MCVLGEQKKRYAHPILVLVWYFVYLTFFCHIVRLERGVAGSLHVCSRGTEETGCTSYLSFSLVFCLSPLFCHIVRQEKGEQDVCMCVLGERRTRDEHFR